MDLSAGEIAAACAGRLLSGAADERFTTLAIDSRHVAPGALFVALPGNRVDGHDYVRQALTAGARGALVMRRVPGVGGRAIVIEVDDTTRALQVLAAHWRARISARVIGVAGSNGKTTVKETLACVLRHHGETFATPGNENSQIGAPLALLTVSPKIELAVLELGTSAPGELDRLARMARPDHAIVTAAFAEHLEWLGDVQGVIAAETEILDALPAGGLALVGSAEQGLVVAARRRVHLRVESLGLRAGDDWRLTNIRAGRSGTRFTLARASEASSGRDWQIPLLGEPAAWAGGFAVAMARELGVAEDAIQRGLEDVRPAAHRLVPIQHPSRPFLVLDDCYNSNPASCLAAVDTAVALAAPEDRLILVIGDMLELGEASEQAHTDLGAEIARRATRADVLVTVGPASRHLARSASAGGMATRPAANAEEALALVREYLRDGRATTLLAKASRGVALDRLVSALTEPD